ncbi:hypothetical protein E2C01_005923 [Portunus trituberculatus]|uniref:Uncharacterized protein n=1 Tax=Portunus trituberculatus TaxID=210409 RepID=A0A5B7CUU5_PORTR|nr:hypothetical protein [Portunus trituberculatus]
MMSGTAVNAHLIPTSLAFLSEPCMTMKGWRQMSSHLKLGRYLTSWKMKMSKGGVQAAKMAM